MLPQYNKITLDNKLEIYHIPMNLGSDVISVNVFYKVGSRNETMGKSGIAHMLEHLNFKSTINRKAGEFDQIVKSFGGINNASTGFDYTHYFIKCSNSNLEKSLELYSDIMQNLNLNDEEFQPERNVVLEERLWRTDNDPFGYLFFRLYNNAFIYHPYHWTPIGFKEDIKNWTIEDIKEFHSIYYQPKNACLLIVGDVKEEDAFNLSKKYFNDIKNGKDIPNLHTHEPTQDGMKKVTIYKESETEILGLGFKIPPFLNKDRIKLEALSEYLGSGKSSLLHKILVDEKELANQVQTYNMSSTDENLFIIFAICNPNIDANLVEKEILSIFEKSISITDNDLEKIKNSVKSDFIYSFDSSSKVSSIYGDYIMRDSLESIFSYQDEINSLTKDDIKEAFYKYFTTRNLTSVILKKDKK